MKELSLGFLGFGNIGVGVWTLINDMYDEIATNNGVKLDIKKILVKDINKEREVNVDKNLLTLNPDDVINNPEIDIVVEFLGGEQPAAEYMLKALKNGKTVVTANKMAFALHWSELHNAAKETKSGLYYEAAVCGAIPIINAVTESMQGNRIDHLYGIVNGTTNDILTRMEKHGLSYSEALKIAMDLGLAEPDPSSDVDGHDAAYKLSILASLCFKTNVKYSDIHIEGISKISKTDMEYAQNFGYRIKLLAIAKNTDGRIEARVHPTFIPIEHPLANINGSMNSVFLHGHACEDMMFMGRGAGSLPTASAVVSDIIRSTEHKSHIYPNFYNNGNFVVDENWESAYYLRFLAKDNPGVLSKIAGSLADNKVSIQSMQQKGTSTDGRVPVMFITHQACEKNIQKAINAVGEDVATLKSIIRVENL